jgi:8-oxo-dGTP pyrophosphatase MutT (NUDIX family)
MSYSALIKTDTEAKGGGGSNREPTLTSKTTGPDIDMHSNATILAEHETDVRSQCGALCWRMHRGRVEVLLITSRETGRWIIPKGWPMAEHTAADAARTEAWEEAGVEGPISQEPIGLYAYDKQRLPEPPVPCVVSVFALRVARLADKFPERRERRRKWFSAAKAAHKVLEPELRAMLLDLDADPKRLELFDRGQGGKSGANA